MENNDLCCVKFISISVNIAITPVVVVLHFSQAKFSNLQPASTLNVVDTIYEYLQFWTNIQICMAFLHLAANRKHYPWFIHHVSFFRWKSYYLSQDKTQDKYYVETQDKTMLTTQDGNLRKHNEYRREIHAKSAHNPRLVLLQTEIFVIEPINTHASPASVPS